MSTLSVYDLDYHAFAEKMHAPHEKGYINEIWHYLYRECVHDFNAMVSLPTALRTRLVETFTIEQPRSVAQVSSPDGNTRKDVLVMADGQHVEVVLLKYRHRFSACVSTQVGCACGCAFCATGQIGYVRDLSAGEIIAQVLYLQRVLLEKGHHLTNIVLMGMGEPLLNYDATLSAVRNLTDSRGLGLGPKRITLSTVGIVPGIRRLTEEPIPLKLAVSLHAATDDVRNSLMPVNRRYPLQKLWDALYFYAQQTGRRIFLEWLMIKGVNDSPEAARTLVSWIGGLPAHVNLIRLNPSPFYAGESATVEAVTAFTDVLDVHRIPHTMRQGRGASIQAGCGQLRSHHRQATPDPVI